MAKNTILSPIEQAFVAAITWDKSDTLAKTKGIIDTQNITTLSDYLSNNRAEHPVSQDVIDSKNNKRTYVIPIDVTRPDGSAFKMNIIVDSKGKDLAVIALTPDGKEAPESFKLASKLNEKLKNNKNALENVIDAKTINDALEVKSLEDMAEKIAKGEKVVADNPKEALEEIKQKNSDVQDKELIDNEQEEEVEIPQEYKSKIEEACEKAGIKPSMLKNAMLVRNPKSLTDSMEGENLSENGGEIVVLQLKSGIQKNPNILVQRSRIDRTGRYDEELSRRINPDSKFGATVENADTDEKIILEYEMGDGTIIKVNLDEEPINSKLSDIEKLDIKERVEAIRDTWETNIAHASSNEEKAIAYENADISLNILEKETGVVLDPIQINLEEEQEEIEEETEIDDGYGDTIEHYGSSYKER